MKERSIKELLLLMKDNIEYLTSGLCLLASNLFYIDNKISHDEYLILKSYIKNNRPSMFSSVEAFKYSKNVFYWRPNHIHPRLKWIDKHIKINS